MTGSAGQRRVPTRYLRDVTLPIPPLNEQHRIVEKIEELVTRLDAGVEALKHAKVQLKQYRQSVLNAAVTGELSRRWREAHASEVEPASELLERILEERRAKWSGKTYKEPVQPENPPLSVLPSEWHWVSISQITQRVTDGTHQSPAFTESGIPFVFVQHIVDGHISFENTKYISEDTYVALNSRCPVEIGDVLYSAVGSYGVAVPVKTSQPFSFQRHIAHIKPLGGLSSDFLVACLNSPLCRRQAHKAARGVAQKTVALGEIVRFQLPLPPLEEQRYIVSEVERRLSIIDRLDSTIEESLKRSEGLRQSILKRAFSGGLVEQDPEDDPASALLERIREERQATDKKGKKGRSKKSVPAEEPSLFSGSEG